MQTINRRKTELPGRELLMIGHGAPPGVSRVAEYNHRFIARVPLTEGLPETPHTPAMLARETSH